MKRIATAMRAVVCGVLSIGVSMTTACGSHERGDEARSFGTLAIPLQTTVGANTYRLDAVFVITGAQGDITLATSGDEAVLSTALPIGSYSASLQSFSLSKKDSTGTFNPIAATVVSSTEPFTVFADSTTTVNFQFETDGTTVSTGSGTVDITFGVTETAVCTVLGSGCPDGYWCAPPALTGAPAACLPGGTTPIGSACASPLECVAPSTCHDFGEGPVCTALCSADQFGQPCATGGTCVEADPSYGICTPETACNPIMVDRVARTVQSERFFLDFSNAVANNPEDLDVLRWTGASTSGIPGDFGPNLTQSWAADACSWGNVAFFGNSLIPPDVDRGGLVLVGAGSTGTWEQDGASIVIHSTSSGCAQSVPATVETRYTFREGAGADTIEVERRFDFGDTPLNHPFRPFVPRLDHANFDQILHPDPSGTILLTESVSNCPYGCGLANWDGSWFAYYASSGPAAGLGMIMLRAASAPGLNAALWVDYDGGFADTNSSSAYLYGTIGQQITEHELLCFFNPETWTPSLTLPPGCTLDLECKAGTPVVGCDPNPCQHGGTCSEAPTGHECTCPAGISGSNCELVFTQLAAGEDHTCGLRNDGSVACWGGLQLGAGDAPAISFSKIAIGLYHGCGIRSDDGSIVCWGDNRVGQSTPPAGSFQDIAAGRFDTCAVSSEGTLRCWGELSDAAGNAIVPPPGVYNSVGAGSAAGRTCAIRTDGTAVCFGYVSGDGSQPPAEAFEAIASGLFESCGIAADGRIACWDLDYRQAQPPSGSFSSLALGLVSGCAIRTDGTLACWGEDTDGNTVPPSGSFKHVVVGQNYGCAVRADDQVICWGSNDWGQLTPP